MSCLVYLPRDRYTTLVRVQVIDALRRAFDGRDVDFTVLVTESGMARLHVVVSTPDGAPAVDVHALEAELAALVRAWVDDLHDAFVDAQGEEAGVESYRRWRRAFPAAYQFEVGADDAVADVAVLETLDPAGDLEIRLEPPVGDVARIKLYRTGGALVLSDVMPLLEHLGVTVVDERPYEIDAPDGVDRWIYSFGVRARRGRPARRPRGAGPRGRRLPRRVGGHDRERRAEPAGAPGGPLRARRRDRARALPVPPPGRRALHRRVPRRHAGREPGGGAPDRRAVPPAARSGAAARSHRGGRRRRRPRAHRRRGGQPRRRPDPARALAAGGGGGADERLSRRAVPGVQARPHGARLPASTATAARALGGVTGGGGCPPPSRRHRPRRHPLVGPAGGLPHRDPRSDEGADGEERGHRAGRSEGWVRGQAPAPGLRPRRGRRGRA